MQLGEQPNPNTKMNSNIIATNLFVAAAASFPVMLVSPVAAGAIVTMAGILSMLALDYGRAAGPVSVPAGIIPFGPACRTLVELRAAA
jgi:hypothetical protein